MAGFRIELFKGMRPRISALKLTPGEATLAQNVDLGSGDVDPWSDKATEQAVSATRQPKTIYRFDNAGSPIWFEWDEYVDVVRGPVKDDSLERTYYTGDSYGTGAPKMTNTSLVGSTGPYPEDWVYIGVPAPTTAVTLEVPALAEDVEVASRVVPSGSIKTRFMTIDVVEYTVHPGVGTADYQWNLASSALGDIAFDIQPGTSFRVTAVVNSNKVELESASESGVFARTKNSDKSTVNDWQPYENNGNTQTADFIGWRLPAGTEVTIVGHNLIVGDVITVSSVASSISYSQAVGDSVYQSTFGGGASWPDLVTEYEDGVAVKRVRDAKVWFNGLFSLDFTIHGSFYYDVDREASASSELEDRQYVYTYVTDLGEEGPPSPVSSVYQILDGQTATISGIAPPPTIGYNITHVRIYRTNSTEAGTEYQFVKEIAVATTTTDAVASAALGEVISTTTWDPPPADMIGLTEMPNGMLVGFEGKNLYFCEPYFPHAWPAEYDQAVGHEIVGLAAFGNSLAVLTTGHPYILTGAHPRNANLRPVKFNQACLSKESIATDGDRVYYASPDGLVEISANGIRLATEGFLRKDDWASYTPSKMRSSFHEGRYFGFYDYDVTAIPAVISAEVSGTVATALESDIVAGGNTVILTLTNDEWVAAGTAFDNQRQNIINGLTCSTDQSLGWNNLVRDTELSVTDVVRTSDTVVTITLPAVSGYSVATDEVIQPTIPASALLISNAAVPTGSTFTVTSEVPAAQVTIGGTADTAGEADIVTGGRTITLSLTNDTWVAAGTDFDAERQGIIDGLAASTNETDGFNDTVPQEIAVTAVVRTSDTLVTITLPAIAAYDIDVDESISATIPATALVTSSTGPTSLNSIAILASAGGPSALFSGTVTASVTENEIIAGGKTLIITLTNDTWIAAGTGPIGTTAESQALLDAILATTSEATGWNAVVGPGIDVATDLVRTSSTVATITLDPEASYAISTSETVGCDIPHEVLTTRTGEDLTVSNTFGITAQSPVTCTLTGTVTASIREDDIVDGGKTIILTLTNDTWLAAGTGPIGSTANTQAIIDGIDSAQAEGTGWDAVVKAGLTPATDVARTSDTVCTITLPAFGTYDITADETITATVPAAALNISAVAVVASPTFSIDWNAPASAVQTGTADDSTSADMYVGSKTIILTLTDDTWVASGATFDAQRQNIIDGLDAASSPSGGWNTQIRDAMAVTAVVRTSNTVVTITLPATETYDIRAAEVITCTIPASALETSSIAVVATDTVDITPVSTATSKLFMQRSTTTAEATHHNESHYDLSYWYEDAVGPLDYSNQAFEVVAYSATETRWVAGLDNTADDQFFSSDDDWDSWTERFPANAANASNVSGLFRSDTHDRWLASLRQTTASTDYFFEYSADGATWVDISAAVLAGVSTTGYWRSGYYTTTPQNRPVFFYGGNYIYALLNDDDDGDENQLVRSAILTTGDVTDNWSAAIKTATSATNPYALRVICSGNGKILAITTDDSASFVQKVEHMNHGGTSFSVGSNSLPTGVQFKTPVFLVYGNDTWVMMTDEGRTIYCDTNGGAVDETNMSNWTYRTYTDNFGGIQSGLVNLFYDAGSGGTDGHGFVLVKQTGIGSAATTTIYTSADGITWTLMWVSSSDEPTPSLRSTQNVVSSKYNLLDGTGLD